MINSLDKYESRAGGPKGPPAGVLQPFAKSDEIAQGRKTMKTVTDRLFGGHQHEERLETHLRVRAIAMKRQDQASDER